jgi:hypothetical protein
LLSNLVFQEFLGLPEALNRTAAPLAS